MKPDQPPISQQVCLSYASLQKSGKVLKDLAVYYLPLYGLTCQDFWDHYALLAFVEAQIYQTDAALEAGQTGAAPFAGLQAWTHHRGLITGLLQELDLMTPHIEAQLRDMGRYWELENQIVYQGVVTSETLIQATELRTSDVRLLHAILVRALDEPHDQALFDLLWPVEVLADIEEDLVQYTDDVAVQHFNTYRMYVKLHGAEAAGRLRADMEGYQALFLERLAALPPTTQKRCMEVMVAYSQERPAPPIPEPIMEF